MSKENKKGLSYYSIDTDRYQDKRIKRLKHNFSVSGIAVYDYLLCEIYRVKGCFMEWDESTAFDVTEYFGLKESTVNEIVLYCGSVGLFDKELLSIGILTSLSIQSRYIRICKLAKRSDCEIPEKYKLFQEEIVKIREETPKYREEIDKEKNSTVKKSKEQESKENRAITFEKIFSEISESERWIIDLAIHLQVTAVYVRKKLFYFLEEIRLKKDWKKGTKEVKNHFINLLKAEILKEKSSVKKENGKSTNKSEQTITGVNAILEKRGLAYKPDISETNTD